MDVPTILVLCEPMQGFIVTRKVFDLRSKQIGTLRVEFLPLVKRRSTLNETQNIECAEVLDVCETSSSSSEDTPTQWQDY